MKQHVGYLPEIYKSDLCVRLCNPLCVTLKAILLLMWTYYASVQKSSVNIKPQPITYVQKLIMFSAILSGGGGQNGGFHLDRKSVV